VVLPPSPPPTANASRCHVVGTAAIAKHRASIDGVRNHRGRKVTASAQNPFRA
jgi:hypothetical protein